MKLIVEALKLLEIEEWVLRGTPTNEIEFNSMFTKVVGKTEDNRGIESSDMSQFGVTWSQIQTALADGGIVAMAELRRQRNILLAETDWMASSDYNMTNAWTTYRQSLRDLPSNSPNVSWDGTTLSNVTFPTKPTE
tara:strand:+ start:333 stop:740 length:408 start_codon:yes stop_codon:yes gene_type:complete